MSAQKENREAKGNEEPLSEEGGFEEAVRKVASTSPAKRNPELPQQAVVHIPEVVDDFLRNFLRRAGLIQTLMVFEAEWIEKLQREPQMTAKTSMSLIPDALTHRQLYQSELDMVSTETDMLRREVLDAGERMLKMQRETDFYRLQCRRAAEDKKKLTEDIKRLKKHLESYEPALRQLDDKYQTALSQKMLISLQKDKGGKTPESRLKQENLQIKKDTCTGANSANKASAKSGMKRQSQDPELPLCSRQVNIQLVQVLQPGSRHQRPRASHQPPSSDADPGLC